MINMLSEADQTDLGFAAAQRVALQKLKFGEC
jgi:hypothetical protein